MRVFSELGYHGSSMEDIAEATGMRKASLYHHVRKKEDLLFAIHELLVEELMDRTAPVFSSNWSASEKLRAIIHAAMEFIASERDGVRVFLQEAGVVSGERWDAIVAKRDAYEAQVANVIREGIASGEFNDLPPKIVARGVLGMANWCYTWFRPDGPMAAGEVAEVFAEMVLRGLRAQGT